MLLVEIVKSCSHDKVADAAVASIGGEFAHRVTEMAQRQGVSTGSFAACAVREFGAGAQPDEWSDLRAVIKGSQQPVLRGLRYILEPALHTRGLSDDAARTGAPPSGGRAATLAQCV